MHHMGCNCPRLWDTCLGVVVVILGSYPRSNCSSEKLLQDKVSCHHPLLVHLLLTGSGERGVFGVRGNHVSILPSC